MVIAPPVLLIMLLVIFSIPAGIGYLLGSLPFGLIFTKLAGLERFPKSGNRFSDKKRRSKTQDLERFAEPSEAKTALGDVRKIGSGNIGATNVLRTGNRKIAAATLLADMLKGTVAVELFLLWFPDLNDTLFMATIAVLGHMFPIWLCFKGGKGVATYLGVLLAILPLLALIFVAVWLACAVMSRYSSLSALIAVLVVGAAGFILIETSIAIPLALMSIIIIIKHRTNIKRLIAGTESKINLSR